MIPGQTDIYDFLPALPDAERREAVAAVMEEPPGPLRSFRPGRPTSGAVETGVRGRALARYG